MEAKVSLLFPIRSNISRKAVPLFCSSLQECNKEIVYDSTPSPKWSFEKRIIWWLFFVFLLSLVFCCVMAMRWFLKTRYNNKFKRSRKRNFSTSHIVFLPNEDLT